MRVKIEMIIEAFDEEMENIVDNVTFHCCEIMGWEIPLLSYEEVKDEEKEDE